MFYVAAGLLTIGACTFLIFGTTKRQEWAKEIVDPTQEKSKSCDEEEPASNYSTCVNPAFDS